MGLEEVPLPKEDLAFEPLACVLIAARQVDSSPHHLHLGVRSPVERTRHVVEQRGVLVALDLAAFARGTTQLICNLSRRGVDNPCSNARHKSSSATTASRLRSGVPRTVEPNSSCIKASTRPR